MGVHGALRVYIRVAVEVVYLRFLASGGGQLVIGVQHALVLELIH